MLWMSNTESSTSPEEALLGFDPPFRFWGGMGAIGVSSEEGKRMCSTDMGEDMVVRSKRRCVGPDSCMSQQVKPCGCFPFICAPQVVHFELFFGLAFL